MGDGTAETSLDDQPGRLSKDFQGARGRSPRHIAGTALTMNRSNRPPFSQEQPRKKLSLLFSLSLSFFEVLKKLGQAVEGTLNTN